VPYLSASAVRPLYHGALYQVYDLYLVVSTGFLLFQLAVLLTKSTDSSLLAGDNEDDTKMFCKLVSLIYLLT